MSENAKRDDNFVPSTLFVGSDGGTYNWKGDELTGRAFVDLAGGSGTVTSVSVVSANGLAGTVATATTTPAITLSTTITGILKGNGTAVSAVTVGSGLSFDGTTLSATAGGGNVSNTGTPVNNQIAVWTDATTIEGDADLTFDTTNNKLSTGAILLSGLTASEIVITDGSKNLVSAAVATYPSLTELTYVKGVTSAIQTQLNAKQATITFGTGVQTALGVNIGSAGAPVLFNGALGTPTSGTVTNLTGTASININGTVGATTPTTGVFTTATANSFIPNSSTIPSNGMYLPLANTLGWAINSAAELRLNSALLGPSTDGGLELGATTIGWGALNLSSAATININNSNWVATHSSGILTVGTGDLRVTTAGTNTASVVTVGGSQTLTGKTLTSPTVTTASLSGTQLLAEGASIGLDPSGSADGAYSGITMTATAGYTQAFGDLVYLSSADSRWEAADADAATTGDRLLAMVVVAGTDGAACTLLMQGTIRADAKFPALTVGSAVYVGETAGEIQVAIPTGADNVIRRVGYALTADSIYFCPSMDSQISVA